MSKKLLDFAGSKISDVKQIHPLFSTCKVRVMYTGKNRNWSNISKEAVEQALPTLIGVPIVGEFSAEAKDFKGHGGAIDLDSYDFIHTTKPYGFVPESATFSWEEVKMNDGTIREYLTVDGCYLWTGRYPEAKSVIEAGKGQSMEIEVNDGDWNDNDETYDIKNFTFSALCILGDEVEPAFENANITSSFSLESDVFKIEYAKMMNDVKATLLEEKEENSNMLLKQLLEKYSTTREVLIAKGLNFSEIAEDELEVKIAEALGVEVIAEVQEEVAEETEEVVETEEVAEEDTQEAEQVEEVGAEADETEVEETEEVVDAQVEEQEEVEQEEVVEEETVDVDSLNERIANLELELTEVSKERDELQEFKLATEKAVHETKAEELFNSFQLKQEDVEGLDVHKFSLEEIEEKCYAIIGRKMAEKKNFSKQENKGIKLPLALDKEDETPVSEYGDLFTKYNK